LWGRREESDRVAVLIGWRINCFLLLTSIVFSSSAPRANHCPLLVLLAY
jgi:hypothetical protein